jgi:exodeoxyribonuclease-3
MRVATWNINGMKARQGYLMAWLQQTQPDIVGLQETKVPDEQFPASAFDALGYRCAFHGQKGWNGVAVLTRSPADVTQVGLPGQSETGARLISVAVDGLTFTTVYIPNGKTIEHEDFVGKLSWLDALADHIAERHQPGDPVIVCGDFNVVPAAVDSWSETALGGGIFHTEAERARIQRLIDWGLVDVYRSRFPDEQGFTWWDYRAGAFHKKQGLRIDLMLASPSVATRITDVVVERQWRKKLDGMIPSDHAPVWADLADR